ncbi:MAG TPA: GNAT family N-acetyltransferase [Acidimicrobiales bacterium]|nr:GNAT family N-acetyltransferase [Acidimicrobiales bacterium]
MHGVIVEPLAAHLRAALGAWPPPADRLLITTSAAREQPGWDGVVRRFQGLHTPDGAVASVERHVLSAFDTVEHPLAEGRAALERVLGRRVVDVMFRWTTEVPALEPVGTWLPAADDRVPAWLKPFGGEVLVVLDGDEYVAGVGLKRHDDHVREISVGTDERARGRGLARRLVVTAARRVLDEGRVPTYLHDLRNEASARVAEAAGFADRGWRLLAAIP